MPTMEAEFDEACSDGRIAGMVLLAGNKAGTFSYRNTFGVRTLNPAAGSAETRPPLEFDTLMRIASASKLVTSVAAMQCVDRGLIGLDDDVGLFDPDLANIQLLSGFDEHDKPLLTAPLEKITLRRLLSHSSGFCYDMLSPLLMKWREIHGQKLQPRKPKLTDRFLYPLVSEPGSEWVYSPSVDWAGRVVERVSGQSLDDFIQANIVQPLGLKKMTFLPQNRPELLKDHADMTVRDKTSGKVTHSPETFWDIFPEESLGGLGLFTTTEDFFEVLMSLLRNDGQLLSQQSVNEFLSPQLTLKAKESMKQFLANPSNEALSMTGSFPSGSERDHSLGGMYLAEDLPTEVTFRRPGTIAWMGYPNFHWFLDPVTGICAVFGSQLEPSDDKAGHELARLFEKTMYERMQAVSN